MVAAICGAAAKGVAVPAIMTGIALAADQKIELPSWLAIKLPGIGEVNPPKLPKINVPKLKVPDLPKLSDLPKVGKAKAKDATAAVKNPKKTVQKQKQKQKEDIFIDENPNVVNAPSRQPPPRIRIGKADGKVIDAPSLEELKAKAGKNVSTGVVIDALGADQYKKFPVRRLPGKNMESFLNMAKDI
mmetsp:Transcript_4397/g.13327  ORF Transcript_4397/g.13327 Transcript_4397/m.13327 type:complete len:187 (+) Transcript_4397:128-688(+)|eukprot:CAMPEP_0198722818 /NCGR_PEP_ID=MMETSP1475-20131203/420_1 /TAXON_ID= ORGANISM="Unidentified sp., Strain CCMP1999" /NCGR_SAMPLE_ID=MMETSP1475 /ASSEMBLY_ACC=CAM_ASM_001111 /LENGTH=186 /DNA_ID=CAMNT_0044483741 /DNA_START=114 /DNA_END=674 /DNA_ORIENTATION=-